jgi:hypothetical protein
VVVNEFEQIERWIRPVDPPGSKAVQLTSIEEQDSPSLTEHGLAAIARLAEPGSLTTLLVKDALTGEVIQNWFADPYAFNFHWSPDEDYLAAVGTALQGGEQAIYILLAAGDQ